MLGELLYELSDIRIVGQRILDSRSLKIETSITAHSIFRKVPIIETTTFWTMPLNINHTNVLYGEANGILTTADNRNEQVGFSGHGLTYKLDNGRIRDRGSRIYQTTNSDKLSDFNNLVGVFEYDIDESGKGVLKIWEWR